jgi:hypothetical protein
MHGLAELVPVLPGVAVRAVWAVPWVARLHLVAPGGLGHRGSEEVSHKGGFALASPGARRATPRLIHDPVQLAGADVCLVCGTAVSAA